MVTCVQWSKRLQVNVCRMFKCHCHSPQKETENRRETGNIVLKSEGAYDFQVCVRWLRLTATEAKTFYGEYSFDPTTAG
jgi:hypothetical protein